MVRPFAVKGPIPSVLCMFLFWLQTLIAFALSPEERGTERGKEEGEEGCREEGEEEKQSQRKSLSSVTPYIRLASASRVVGLKHALPHPFLGCWFVLVFCFMYMFGFCWYYLYFIFPDMVSSLETCNVVKNVLKLLILLHLHPLAWVTHIRSLSSLVLFCNLFSTFDSPVIIKNPSEKKKKNPSENGTNLQKSRHFSTLFFSTLFYL